MLVLLLSLPQIPISLIFQLTQLKGCERSAKEIYSCMRLCLLMCLVGNQIHLIPRRFVWDKVW